MEDRPIVSPGSMFKSSESWFTLIINAMLADGMASAQSWQAQAACALGAALVTCAYIWSRTRTKSTALEVGE